MFLLTLLLLLPAAVPAWESTTSPSPTTTPTPTPDPYWSDELNERSPFNMQWRRFRFKTSTENGENVNIMFFGNDGRYLTTLRLQVQVGSTPKYGLRFCSYDDRQDDVWEQFPGYISDESEHIWAVQKETDGLTIFCDGVKVLEYDVYELGEDSKCAKKWGPDFHHAKFTKADNEAVVAFIPEYNEPAKEYFSPPKNVDIPYDMDRHDLRFLTNLDNSNDSPSQSEIMLLGDEGVYLGQLSIRFSEPMAYKLRPCTSREWQEFPTAPPNFTEKLWVIKKSEKQFTLFCRDREVLRVNFLHSGCDAALSQRIKYINFLGYDTATEHCYCPIEFAEDPDS